MFKRKSKSTSPTDTIVTSDSTHLEPVKSGHTRISKPRLTKRTAFVGTLAAVVVVAVPILYMYGTHSGLFSDGISGTTTLKPGENVSGQELSVAERALSEAKTSKERAEAYSTLSNLYLNIDDGKEKAVDYANESVKEQPTVASYAQLGFALESRGDYEAAAEAYGRAAELSEKTALNDGRSDYSYYMHQKLRMESQ